MMFQTEVTTQEIRDIAESKIKAAIADKTQTFKADLYIREQIGLHFNTVVEELVRNELVDSDALRAKISSEIERRLSNMIASELGATRLQEIGCELGLGRDEHTIEHMLKAIRHLKKDLKIEQYDNSPARHGMG